jgi:serine/threonine-protein kinase
MPVIAPGAPAIAERPPSGSGAVASFAPGPGPDHGGVRRYGAVIIAVLALSGLGLAGRLAFATDVPARPPSAGSQATSTASGRATTASTVTVPDVVGLGRDAAAAGLRAAGLVVRESPEQDGSARSGLVLAVDPVPGSSVPRGSGVVLVVASGRTTLPDVMGASLDAALSALSRAGLAVTWRRVPATVDGVLAMTPRPGSLVGRGSTVQLVVGVPGRRAAAPVTAGASATPTATPSPEGTSPSPPPSPSPSSSPTPSVS